LPPRRRPTLPYIWTLEDSTFSYYKKSLFLQISWEANHEFLHASTFRAPYPEPRTLYSFFTLNCCGGPPLLFESLPKQIVHLRSLIYCHLPVDFFCQPYRVLFHPALPLSQNRISTPLVCSFCSHESGRALVCFYLGIPLSECCAADW
jgi:hypothetical protein